jgi:uncharacterized protein (TIGR02271 family)
MMNRDEFLRRHPDLQPNLVAVSGDGETLGNVTSLNENSVDIARGEFFPRDFAVRYDDIGQANDGRLILNQSGDDLNAWKDPDYEGWQGIDELNRGTEVDITLREELIEAQTTMRPAGQVRLRKVVHTEEKTFTVPVAREEVHVERIQMNEPVEAGLEGQAFQEEEITIPVMEEQVEIVKHLRIKGRVHARKTGVIEQQMVSGSVRTEEVEVLREGPHGGGQEGRSEEREEAGGEEGSGEEGYED